ncbi:hypothetical protein QR680_003571 [Steinernema hermaphroditum]|uniref:Uncharacterized protein n=1 Tax=Steinernema hermaphroditum TaxID=289476 RepID=A0AA39HKU5_9BILA|nr:hypothetical protein QR680_003571 [Steinernema hermaphroditum]
MRRRVVHHRVFDESVAESNLPPDNSTVLTRVPEEGAPSPFQSVKPQPLCGPKKVRLSVWWKTTKIQ